MKRLCAGAVLCFALTIPAFASDDEEGWFFAVEATSMKPSGGVQDYTIVDPDFDFDVEGTVRSLEYDYQLHPRVHVGHLNGDGSMWSLSWWNYDETATDSVTSPAGGALWDILYEAGDADDQFVGTASAEGMMDATLLDLSYARPLTSSDKFHTRWNVGLRLAEIENTISALYDDGTDVANATLGAGAEGIGITGGLNGTYELSDRWTISGESRYSFLTGEFDTLTRMIDGTTIETDLRGEKDGTFTIFEASCSVVWHGPDWLYLWLTWEFAQWNNVLQTNNFPDDVSPGFIDARVDDVSWEGWTVGAGFQF